MSAAACRAEVGVTGMNFGSAVVPLVVANISGASAVRTRGSPASTRLTYGRSAS